MLKCNCKYILLNVDKWVRNAAITVGVISNELEQVKEIKCPIISDDTLPLK